MIEVEKKFKLNRVDITRLIQGAEFLSEKTFTDTYYDTNDYVLTSKDVWLRERDGQYELKVPLHNGAERAADQYDEITDIGAIAKRLNLSSGDNLKDKLIEKGYQPFCTCTTTRKKYKKNQFTIDLDLVDYGDFTYTLGEIELLVRNKSEINEAISKILDFVRQNQLVIGQVRGKVIEYIKQKRPSHYQRLVRVGVVRDR